MVTLMGIIPCSRRSLVRTFVRIQIRSRSLALNKIAFETEEEKECVDLVPCILLQRMLIFGNRWLALDVTTTDVKANCDDLKVLGKGDFKALLKWRIALREEVGLRHILGNTYSHDSEIFLYKDRSGREDETCRRANRNRRNNGRSR
jgi:hypothetical protein